MPRGSNERTFNIGLATTYVEDVLSPDTVPEIYDWLKAETGLVDTRASLWTSYTGWSEAQLHIAACPMRSSALTVAHSSALTAQHLSSQPGITISGGPMHMCVVIHSYTPGACHSPSLCMNANVRLSESISDSVMQKVQFTALTSNSSRITQLTEFAHQTAPGPLGNTVRGSCH